MRSMKGTFGIIMVLFLLTACSKEQQRFLDENNWYLHSMKSSESDQWELADKIYGLSLDVAEEFYQFFSSPTLCGAEFGLGRNHGIYFDVVDCKLTCCNTSYGSTVVDILSKVERWKLNGDTLVLSGRDSLKFLPYN
jgi:hypothetical protein